MSETEQTTEAQRAPKVIKRYTNRKLYDTVESRYVTLDEISEMIRAGSEVQIIDNRTKEDLTSVTLAQIIFEEEKKRSKMPLGMLRDIIRHGGETLSGFLQVQVGQAGQKLQSFREEAEVLRDRILRPVAADPSKPNALDQARELANQSQRAVEEWQRRIDERVRQAMENVTSLPALAKDVATLEKRIAELEKRLEEAERK